MIVWGGDSATGALRSGGVLNLLNQKWLFTSLTGAPTARVEHTAVYRENSLQSGNFVVWGGDAGGVTNTGGVYDPPQDFQVGPSPSHVVLTIPGAQMTNEHTVWVTSLNGLSGPVHLALTGLPGASSGSFSTNPVTVNPNGSNSSLASYSIASSLPTGDYSYVLGGSWDIHTRTFPMILRVQDFSLACDPVAVVAPGGDAVTTCRVTSLNGFDREVSLGCGNWSCSLDPQLVSPPADGEVTTELTIHVDGGQAPGNYQVEFVGSRLGTSRIIQVNLEVAGTSLIFSDGFESGNTSAWN